MEHGTNRLFVLRVATFSAEIVVLPLVPWLYHLRGVLCLLSTLTQRAKLLLQGASVRAKTALLQVLVSLRIPDDMGRTTFQVIISKVGVYYGRVNREYFECNLYLALVQEFPANVATHQYKHNPYLVDAILEVGSARVLSEPLRRGRYTISY